MPTGPEESRRGLPCTHGTGEVRRLGVAWCRHQALVLAGIPQTNRDSASCVL